MNDIEGCFLGRLDLEFLFEEGHGKRLAVSPEATPHNACYFTSSQTDPGGLLRVVRALQKLQSALDFPARIILSARAWPNSIFTTPP